MLLADAYVDRIDFLKYLPQTDCGACGVRTCKAFVGCLKRAEKDPSDCPDLGEHLLYPFAVSLGADSLLPQFACIPNPQPGPIGIVEINSPSTLSPILVSGNHVHTQDVITAVLSTTGRSFFLVFLNTQGDTVDMAVILRTFTAKQVKETIAASHLFSKSISNNIILPGLASGEAAELKAMSGWNIIVGPVCAAELPLFYAETWTRPNM
jgi:CO dehydrogenase/acetyl-CoA synthase gamma subunit (corrinoid Fe-S protein)